MEDFRSALGGHGRGRTHSVGRSRDPARDEKKADSAPGEQGTPRTAEPEGDSSFIDHYEVLQISPNADLETIHRVYRLLAQRYHPDNNETANEEAFRAVLQAFGVLSDPEKRATYDVQYRVSRALRWKIFDQKDVAGRAEAERKTREGILSILCTKRLEEPSKPGVTVRDLEALLGCPREHLEFSLWYLKAKSLVEAVENGRYVITAEGVDSCPEFRFHRQEHARPLLPSGNATPSTAAKSDSK